MNAKNNQYDFIKNLSPLKDEQLIENLINKLETKVGEMQELITWRESGKNY